MEKGVTINDLLVHVPHRTGLAVSEGQQSKIIWTTSDVTTIIAKCYTVMYSVNPLLCGKFKNILKE